MLSTSPETISRFLVESIKHQHGFDFSQYRPTMLLRRMNQRMHSLGFTENLPAYLDYLAANPGEHARLVDLFFINHTAFFRDVDVWNTLQTIFLPRIFEAKQPDEPVRIWSAGCATGQEVYSIAILLDQLMGRRAFRSRVTIYGTDVDVPALEHARQGTYQRADVESHVSPDFMCTYFEAIPTENSVTYRFRTETMCEISYQRHNMLTDPPLTGIDLFLCRNLLIYFQPACLRTVFAAFERALNPHGLLVLGKAETAQVHSDAFMPLDIRHHIYGKKSVYWPHKRWAHG